MVFPDAVSLTNENREQGVSTGHIQRRGPTLTVAIRRNQIQIRETVDLRGLKVKFDPSFLRSA